MQCWQAVVQSRCICSTRFSRRSAQSCQSLGEGGCGMPLPVPCHDQSAGRGCTQGGGFGSGAPKSGSSGMDLGTWSDSGTAGSATGACRGGGAKTAWHSPHSVACLRLPWPQPTHRVAMPWILCGALHAWQERALGFATAKQWAQERSFLGFFCLRPVWSRVWLRSARFRLRRGLGFMAGCSGGAHAVVAARACSFAAV